MSNKKILPNSFFEKSATEVAQKLLGKFLVRLTGKQEIAVMITEVEAYDGFKDKASHASHGKTKRNLPMFGPPGYWYVYLCYGMYWMLNIVTGPKNYPAAVLIRGVITKDGKNLNGPGKLTKFLKINRQFNGKRAEKKTGLWIQDSGKFSAKPKIHKGPRIGVDYAGSVWSKKHYRFWIDPV